MILHYFSRRYGHAVLLNVLPLSGSILSLMPTAMILWMLHRTHTDFGWHYMVQSYSFLALGLGFWVVYGGVFYLVLRYLDRQHAPLLLEREVARLLGEARPSPLLRNVLFWVFLVLTVLILAVAKGQLVGDQERGFLVSVFALNSTALLQMPASIRLTYHALVSLEDSHGAVLEDMVEARERRDLKMVGVLVVVCVFAYLVL